MIDFLIIKNFNFIIGLLLLIIEIYIQTGYFFILGFCTLFIVLITCIFPTVDFYILLLFFNILIIICIIICVFFSKTHYHDLNHIGGLNKLGSDIIGKMYILYTPIINGGIGTIRIRDSVWLVSSTEDISSGTKIHVIGKNGSVLLVEKFTH